MSLRKENGRKEGISKVSNADPRDHSYQLYFLDQEIIVTNYIF